MTATTAAVEVVPRRRRIGRRAPALGVSGWLALAVIALVVVMALFAPLVAPHDPDTGNLLTPYAGPSGAHWLGTDATGRDIASRLIYGARTSLLGPAAIVLLSLLIGVPLALVSAWRGGLVAFVITRALDVLFAIPGMLIAILAAAVFGAGLRAAVLALAVAYLPYTARVIVSAAERERRQEYVRALTVQGASAVSISVRHVLRNIAPLIASQSTVAFAYALIDLASLSFLGLAVQPPQADWGVLASDRDAVLQGHSMQVVAASVLVVATVLALFVVGARLAGERPSVRGFLRRGTGR